MIASAAVRIRSVPSQPPVPSAAGAPSVGIDEPAPTRSGRGASGPAVRSTVRGGGEGFAAMAGTLPHRPSRLASGQRMVRWSSGRRRPRTVAATSAADRRAPAVVRSTDAGTAGAARGGRHRDHGGARAAGPARVRAALRHGLRAPAGPELGGDRPGHGPAQGRPTGRRGGPGLAAAPRVAAATTGAGGDSLPGRAGCRTAGADAAGRGAGGGRPRVRVDAVPGRAAADRAVGAVGRVRRVALVGAGRDRGA